MVECRWSPACDLVTVFADIAGRQVRRRLAGGFCAIVTAETITRNARMVEGRRCPAAGLVAILTDIVGCDVVR